jgi:predicted transposase/invertase (TIGR01784 family)
VARRLVSFDWAMKKILREKTNFVILEGFLSELLKFDVEIVEILESEANQENENDRFNRVDLLAKNQNGELILVEIRYNDEIDYFQRMLYGTAKLITQYIQKGKGYSKVKKVYSIDIVYSEIGQGDDYVYHGKTEFKGPHKNDILASLEPKKDEFVIRAISNIYPEYYILYINQFDDIVKNTLDEWIYFLKNEEIENNFKAKGLDEAKSILDVLKLKLEDRAKYEREMENQRYKESIFYTAEVKGKKKGLEEGLKKGKKEGSKEGIEKGIEKGEKKAQIEIAKNLLNSGVNIELIIQSTGLSREAIEKLL